MSLLRAEGLTDIRYVPVGSGDLTEAVGGGRLDFALNFASSLTAVIDSGVPITALAGIHCKRRSKNPSLKRPVSPVAPE